MWHTAARQASQLHSFPHDQRKGRPLDGTAVGVADQGDAVGGRGLDCSKKRGMQGDGQLGGGLLLNHPDQTVGEVGPARVLRYAAAYKDLDEPLRDFIKRRGGINKCASRFAPRLGRGRPDRAAQRQA